MAKIVKMEQMVNMAALIQLDETAEIDSEQN